VSESQQIEQGVGDATAASVLTEASDIEVADVEVTDVEVSDAEASDVSGDTKDAAADGDDDGENEGDPVSLLVREGDIAGDYLERLLDIVDYDGDIDLDVENDRAMVAIVGGNELKPLVGPRGATLDALQELTRLAVQQQTGVRSRLMLDISGYRAGRRAELTELARRTANEVAADGDARSLVPMNAFERKVVHDAIAVVDGVSSESEGEDPQRRVVVSPTD
jgi:spoIIIJ-associated protein